MTYNKKVKKITDDLENGIKEVFESEKYKEYLKTVSKFHKYSYNNCLLITMQKPNATMVAGFNSWKKNFQRYVNKGEKGIKILAPNTYKKKVRVTKLNPETKKPLIKNGKKVTEIETVQKMSFRTVSVFDISQTSGKELTRLTSELKGDVKEYDKFIKSLKSFSPCPIEIKNIDSNAKGYYNHADNKITVKKGMSELQTIKTIIHEITHSELHSTAKKNYVLEKKSKNTREVEAESVAYIVSNYYGLDTSEYSFSYLASWSSDKELTELKDSLKVIKDQASHMINEIDEKFKKLEKTKIKSKDKKVSIKNKIDKAKKKSKNTIKDKNKSKTKMINKSKNNIER